MLSALPSLLLAVPQCRDGWTPYTENGATKCVYTTFETHGIALYNTDCVAVCESLARPWLDALDPTPQNLCMSSEAEVAWWHANSPRATHWVGISRTGGAESGARWSAEGGEGVTHLNDQCIASASSFYTDTFAHSPSSGESSNVWANNDPGLLLFTTDMALGTEDCLLMVNEVAANGDHAGGGPGWCAHAPRAAPRSARAPCPTSHRTAPRSSAAPRPSIRYDWSCNMTASRMPGCEPPRDSWKEGFCPVCACELPAAEPLACDDVSLEFNGELRSKCGAPALRRDSGALRATVSDDAPPPPDRLSSGTAVARTARR